MRASSFIAPARFLVQQVSEAPAWIISFALDTREDSGKPEKYVPRAPVTDSSRFLGFSGFREITWRDS